jgi:hypothetical protein
MSHRKTAISPVTATGHASMRHEVREIQEEVIECRR